MVNYHVVAHFLYDVSPAIDSYEALYSIISYTIHTHRSSHNETRNIRHFTQFLYDVSPLFSKAGPQGELEGEAGSRLRAAPSNNNAFPTLSQSVKI